MTIFLDTGPLYGLMIPRDQHHHAAVEAFAALDGAGVQLPFTTALELHRLIVHRKPRDPGLALSVMQRLLERYPLAMPTNEDAEAALELLSRYRDQAITLADAVLASMAARAGARVLTFDRRHFGLLGAEVYG